MTPSDLRWRIPLRSGPYLHGATGPSRLVGLDAARGLAVLGMFVAHIGITSYGFTSVEGWLSLAHGRPSVLFAVIAGFSLGLITGRETPHSGDRLVHTRLRLLVRSALLLAIAAVLYAVQTNVSIILGYYATWFALALPFLRWRPRHLFVLAGATLLVGSLVVLYLPNIFQLLHVEPFLGAWDGNGAVLDFLLTGMYPGAVWMAYIFVGLGLARLDWSRPSRVGMLAATGLALTLVGYLGGHLLFNATAESPQSFHFVSPETDYGVTASDPQLMPTGDDWDEYLAADPGWDGISPLPPPPVSQLFSTQPHSDTLFEGIASIGVALLVIGVCLPLGRAVPVLLAPLAAVGSMSLTTYSLHIPVIRIINEVHPAALETNWPVLWLTLGMVTFAMVWKAIFARGPLEHWVHVVSLRATHTSPDTGPASSSATLPPWPPSPVP